MTIASGIKSNQLNNLRATDQIFKKQIDHKNAIIYSFIDHLFYLYSDNRFQTELLPIFHSDSGFGQLKAIS
ncbi:hypothetical protein Catovirus_2_2 [Catovirus CTV1]|uniref:Uncharacterized protein n=1 Tax=Catovirus CTV1 TaxID=1977631 RepID=A0A1V0SBG5_9VIRU|nr:hypothetical protein Catovirus_2_2 [Catovirus CTV1]